MWPFTPREPKIFTGRIRTQAEMRLWFAGIGCVPTFGKQLYAEVNSGAVVWLARQACDELFADGITRWRADATCTLFATEFAAKANRIFFRQAFHDPVSSALCALGAGEIWFHPDNAPGSGHAIGVAFTELGALFIDPQAPDQLRPLSRTELSNAFALGFL